jgi:hypothetical protein
LALFESSLKLPHHALENHHCGFYNGGRIHFEDKKAIFMTMDNCSTPSNVEVEGSIGNLQRAMDESPIETLAGVSHSPSPDFG